MKKTFSYLILFLFSFSFAQIETSKLVPKVLKQLDLNINNIHQDFYVEKVLPFEKSKTLILIPKFVNTNYNNYDSYFYTIKPILVIVDNNSGKILNQFNCQEIISDAIKISSIVLDTGLYYLKSDLRAVGVRVHFSGSSSVYPMSNELLSLYIPENKSFKNVLNSFTISNYNSDWDTKCAGESKETNSFLSMDEKNSSNGFRNINVHSKIKLSKTYVLKGECKEKNSTNQTNRILKFNGKEYK